MQKVSKQFQSEGREVLYEAGMMGGVACDRERERERAREPDGEKLLAIYMIIADLFGSDG